MSDPVTIADIYALFQASQAEDDRRAAEADKQMQELKRIAANTSREVAGLTTRWGQFVEIDEGVDRYAYQRGLFVIKQIGDIVAIANAPTFQPTPW